MISQWAFTVPMTAQSVRRLTQADVTENGKRIGQVLFGNQGELRVERSEVEGQLPTFTLIYLVDHVPADDPRLRRHIKRTFIDRFVRPGFNHDLCILHVSALSTLDPGVVTRQTALPKVPLGC